MGIQDIDQEEMVEFIAPNLSQKCSISRIQSFHKQFLQEICEINKNKKSE